MADQQEQHEHQSADDHRATYWDGAADSSRSHTASASTPTVPGRLSWLWSRFTGRIADNRAATRTASHTHNASETIPTPLPRPLQEPPAPSRGAEVRGALRELYRDRAAQAAERKTHAAEHPGAASPTGEEDPEVRQERYRTLLKLGKYQTAIETQLEEARKKGAFDNLQGKGKPLDLSTQPGEREGTWAVHRVMGDQNFTLPWMMLAKEIDDDLAACKRMVAQAPLASRIRRRELREEHRKKAQGVREKLRRYNLMVPSTHLQRPPIDIQGMLDEMEHAGE